LKGFPRTVQTFVSSTHSTHYHLSLRAVANFSRCKMPWILRFVGRPTFSHFTLHFSLLTLSQPFHK
jgi:hypothetical protein